MTTYRFSYQDDLEARQQRIEAETATYVNRLIELYRTLAKVEALLQTTAEAQQEVTAVAPRTAEAFAAAGQAYGEMYIAVTETVGDVWGTINGGAGGHDLDRIIAEVEAALDRNAAGSRC